MAVFQDVKRVLRDDGILWVNMGNSYGGSGKGTGGQLLGIPWRFAFRMVDAGWILRQEIIWAKDSPMPESLGSTRWERHRVKVGESRHAKHQDRDGTFEPTPTTANGGNQAQWADCPGCATCSPNDGLVLRRGSWRCTEATESIFMFVKKMGYFCDGEAVKVANTEGSLARWKNDGPGTRKDGYLEDRGRLGVFTHGESYHVGNGANRRNVWRIKPEPYKGGHYATFPTGLPTLCIQASTSEAGACPRCGAQWARVIERKNMIINRSNHQTESGIRIMSSGTMESPPETQTLGFRPTCTCGETRTVPPLVLDPFAGTCTTAVAAQRLGRRSVMIDLSAQYLVQGRNRLLGEKIA